MPFVPYIVISLAFFKSMQGKNFCLLPLPLPLPLPRSNAVITFGSSRQYKKGT